jgi:shikimate dehydrogenase
MHIAALDATSLTGEYVLYPDKPTKDEPNSINQKLQRLIDGKLTGLNVTIPYKQIVMPLLDQLTPAATQIGAVNVLYIEDGKLTGDNTDSQAFMTDLNQKMPELQSSSKNALVLGGGGSARAVVFALQQNGWNIHIATRKPDQASQLIVELTLDSIQTVRLDADAHSNIQDIQLIVNTTPVGMAPCVDENPWPVGLPLWQGAVVYDLIYNPVETRLMKKARLSGLNAVNGMGMLVEQAALSFERWTGVSAPREVMLAAALSCYER